MRRFTFFLICAIISVTLSFQVSSQSIVTDGLVSYWTFDKKHVRNNEVKDVWGENDGTSSGNPKMVPGKVGDALEFDGLNDYVNLTNLGDFGSQLGSSTFEAWIKIYRKKHWKYLFNIHDGCMEWYLKIYGEQVRNEIQIGISFKKKHLNNGCHGIHGGLISPRISDGKWHHVVYTNQIVTINVEDDRKKIKQRIFIDGKSLIGDAHDIGFPEALIPFRKPFYLGAFSSTNGFFHGAIDEVRIYNRPLTEDDVIQNYESRTVYSVEPAEKLPIMWGTLKSKL